MGTLSRTLTGILLGISLFFLNRTAAQKTMNSFAVTQQDPRLYVAMEYQIEDNSVLGAFTQDYRITVRNKTRDKLHVYIEYYAETVCGKRRTSQFAPLIDGYIMAPGEEVIPTLLQKPFGYQRFTQNECPKNSWRLVGKDKNGNKTYSIINSLGYRIIKIINLSEQERKVAEAKKLKEEQDKKQKEAEVKEKKVSTSANSPDQSTDNHQKTSGKVSSVDFWGEEATKAGVSKSINKEVKATAKNGDLYEKDADFLADGKFKNKLSGIKQGEYFTDGAGGYYKKELGGARKVDKAAYELASAKKIYNKMAREQEERQQRDADFKRNWDNINTSFYAMSSAREGLADASDLGSGFADVEQLNKAFNQKMREISAMASQVQAASTQAAQAYSKTIGTGSNGYDYSGYTNAIGGIAAAIAANKAQKDAQEELRRQRDEEHARIKKAEHAALISIRSAINKTFKEGGMPLSTHNISAPILYLFAYNSPKAEWEQNKFVPMTVTNVIPVYRYSDGTYPFKANVDRIFEQGGLSSPVLMGYFTKKEAAESYRNSLLELAAKGKFTIKTVEIKVKEKTAESINGNMESPDFWGTRKVDQPKNKNIGTKEKTDFWGMPVKG